jgi:hypothetical protein
MNKVIQLNLFESAQKIMCGSSTIDYEQMRFLYNCPCNVKNVM